MLGVVLYLRHQTHGYLCKQASVLPVQQQGCPACLHSCPPSFPLLQYTFILLASKEMPKVR